MWFWFFISYLMLISFGVVVLLIFWELTSAVFDDENKPGAITLFPPTPAEDAATLAYVNNNQYLRTDGPDAKQVKITTTNLPPINVTLPMGTIMATTIVNILEPVLMVSKQDDIRIYYPDNSVEYFSKLNDKWEKIPTSYKNVYEYATRTNCIIVENL